MALCGNGNCSKEAINHNTPLRKQIGFQLFSTFAFGAVKTSSRGLLLSIETGFFLGNNIFKTLLTSPFCTQKKAEEIPTSIIAMVHYRVIIQSVFRYTAATNVVVTHCNRKTCKRRRSDLRQSGTKRAIQRKLIDSAYKDSSCFLQ